MDKDLERAYHESGLNLSLIPLDDLLNEVKRRFDACMILGDQWFTRARDEQSGAFTAAWKGSPQARLGLAHTAVVLAEAFVRDQFVRREPDDEP